MHGATWTEDGQGLYFDGQDDWVGIGEMNYDNVTLEVVIMHNDVDKEGNQCIVDNFEQGGYGIDYNDPAANAKRLNAFGVCARYEL